MEEQETNDDGVRKCPKCKVPVEDKQCPICDMREIDMDDEDESDWREHRR